MKFAVQSAVMTVQDDSVDARQAGGEELARLAAEGPAQLLDRSIGEYGRLLRETPGALRWEHVDALDYALRHTVVRLLVRAAEPVARVYPLPLMGWAELLHGEVTAIERPLDQRLLWQHDESMQLIAQAIGERIAAHERGERGAAHAAND